MQPLVSIGMSVYNCEKTLDLALQSIVQQSYQNWELILIDDGSTDQTLQVAQRWNDQRIKLFADGKNRKLPARLNEAISLSQGKYFARMDGDDISYPLRLEKQVAFLESYPEVDLVGSWLATFTREDFLLGKRTCPENHTKICSRLAFTSFGIGHATITGQLKWFQQHRYNENFRIEDQELFFRTHRNSLFANIPEILYAYRLDEHRNLKKYLTARYLLLPILVRGLFRDGKPGQAALALIMQITKAMLDIAFSLGTKCHLLRHSDGHKLSLEEQNYCKNLIATLQKQVATR